MDAKRSPDEAGRHAGATAGNGAGVSASLRLRLLGSADALPVPRPYCACRLCVTAAERKGKDVRTRTHMHVFPGGLDGREPRYAVDLSPDLSHHMIRDGFWLRRVEHLLITHAHYDHLDVSYLLMRKDGKCELAHAPPLTVYGSEPVANVIQAAGVRPEEHRVELRVVAPGERFRAGALDVLAIPATHGPEPALNYVLSHGGRSVLIGWDTGPWRAAAWDLMRDQRLDAVFMECTEFASGARDWETHLSFDQTLAMRRGLLERGIIAEETPLVTVHMGHHGGLLHAERAELGAPHGIAPGYDGFELGLDSTA